jgi:hypothetical protein
MPATKTSKLAKFHYISKTFYNKKRHFLDFQANVYRWALKNNLRGTYNYARKNLKNEIINRRRKNTI